MKLLEKIKNFFKKLWPKAKEFKEQLEDKYLPIASNIVNAVKIGLDSQAVDFITKHVIKGEKDDQIVELARKVITKTASELLFFTSLKEEDITQAKFEEVLYRALEVFPNLLPEERQRFLSTLGAIFYQKIKDAKEDGKITFGEAAVLLELFYQEVIKK